MENEIFTQQFSFEEKKEILISHYHIAVYFSFLLAKQKAINLRLDNKRKTTLLNRHLKAENNPWVSLLIRSVFVYMYISRNFIVLSQ